jgi:uncharacterized protein
MYDQGLGVPRSQAEAAKWYRKAADQGDDMAQFNVGTMYVNGQGVRQDLVRHTCGSACRQQHSATKGR